MRKLIYLMLAIIPLAVALGTLAVSAQDLDTEWFGIGPGMGAGGQWKDCIGQALNAAGVTEAQKADLKAIREKYAPQIREILKSGMAPEAKREAIQKLKAEARVEMEAVLPQAQRQAIRKWMAENCKRPGPGPVIGARVECFNDALRSVVTDAAKKRQIAAIEQKLKADLEALRKDPSIPTEQKKAKAGEFVRAAHQQIQSLLTDREKAAIREWMMANCRGKGPGPNPGPKQGIRPGVRLGPAPAR